MPALLRERFTLQVAHYDATQLELLGENLECPSRNFRNLASKIVCNGSGSGYYHDLDDSSVKGKHDPDISLQVLGTAWPGVIIRVSYDQKRKALPYLADDYILGSDANVRLVIALDVEYKGRKKATLSSWRPVYVDDEENPRTRDLIAQICDEDKVRPPMSDI